MLPRGLPVARVEHPRAHLHVHTYTLALAHLHTQTHTHKHARRHARMHTQTACMQTRMHTDSHSHADRQTSTVSLCVAMEGGDQPVKEEPSASNSKEAEGSGAANSASLAHMGPIEVEGTLMAADKQAIKETTGLACSVRARNQWSGQRCLTLAGPANKLDEALALCYQAMEKNEGRDRSAEAGPASTAAKAAPKTAGAGGGKAEPKARARKARTRRARASKRSRRTRTSAGTGGSSCRGGAWSRRPSSRTRADSCAASPRSCTT